MTQLEQRPTAARSPKRNSRTRRFFVVDLVLFGLFLLVMNVPLTGLVLHEWLGIAIAVALVAHLVQHGDWIATIWHRLGDATSLQNRANYLMMVGLFIGFASITVSGLLISEVAFPWIGYTPGGGQFWLWLHLSSVGWVVALVALHIALNWRWIVNTSERLVFAPLRRRSNY
jgi:thiosulfate reductase cytochrome b subunit